jgi:tol-pal system protein YbgF
MARLTTRLMPALACLLLSSCVYDQEMSYFNDQIVALNRRVTSLEESAGSDLPAKLDTLQSNQARLQVEIDQLKNEISELSGRTEDNEHLLRRIVEQDLSGLDAMKARLDALTEKSERLDRMVRQQQQYLNLEPPPEEQPAPVQPSEGRPPARPAPSPGEGSAAPEEAVPSGEIELYEYALGLYREGKYNEAQQTFRSFLDRYPKSDRADNAHFWIGEADMALGQYEQAILAFQNVIKDYPRGNKVANAMLRQAVAFLEINDKTSARLLLKKIVKEHPGTSEAELAKKKLDAL